ncbi:MAG: reverse transcriptase/maturase family protein [Candidatus Pacearchaeota archaeon]|nr:reverse transcriptase/maturase family protein [Candidatus Pacearchaeota archaeon]
MKTHKNLFQKVCKFENLYNAYLKARKGKNNTAEVIKFTYNLEDELLKLQHELRSQTYKTGKYRHFTIFEPKERRISALPFRDRIVHHAICNVIESLFDKTFIYDSYACRKGKGTHAGADRIQKFIRKANSNSYVLKCDISKYFPSVNHEILKQIIREKISDNELLQLLDQIVDSPNQENSDEMQEAQNFEHKGLPIGNLTSQLFANMYLDKLDKYVKYILGIKYYIRYMDDFVIMHKSKASLHELKEKVILFLVSMRLIMHPKKVDIFPVSLGIDFLGYRTFSNYRLVRKSTIKRFLKGVKIKLKKYDTEIISFDKLMESFNSWEAYMDYGDSYNLQKSLHERYFKNVM